MLGSPPRYDTRVLPFGPAAVAEAARLIRAGQPVALPTETVYGLAADAGDGEAIARLYAAKGRPAFNPLIVHLASRDAAEDIAQVDELAERLAAAFWPGPLTLVLPLEPGGPIASLVTAGLPTVALRVPAHPAMRAVLEATGLPLAAPSANASGRVSPTRAAHVLATLRGRVPLVVDGGPTSLGLESTVVRPLGDRVVLLRPGPLGADEIARVAGVPVSPAADGAAIASPGQLASHYAPAKPLRLGAVDRRPGEWLIGFGPIAGDSMLSAGGSVLEAAARLFDLLHEADASGAESVAVAPVPEAGVGAAINDRLRRAAAR